MIDELERNIFDPIEVLLAFALRNCVQPRIVLIRYNGSSTAIRTRRLPIIIPDLDLYNNLLVI
jgi:hypothetical protein